MTFCVRFALLFVLGAPAVAAGQQTSRPAEPASIVAQAASGRFVVVYRSGRIPANADALIAAVGAHAVVHLAALGVSGIAVEPGREAEVQSRLAADPQVRAVLQDRIVRGHALLLGVAARPGDSPATSMLVPGQGPSSAMPAIVTEPATPVSRPQAPKIFHSIGDLNGPGPATLTPAAAYDTLYDSPQGWAVRQAGGYGDGVPGGPAAGPWNTSRGAGIRIAVIDSGVDATHPDIAPNLVYQRSFVDQTASGEPSPCDDGSPQDQSGHGTWVASLAAGAMGPGTGNVVGVAPQASLLSIKVLERLPAASGASTLAQCEAGQPGGLLSWVLAGIDDAVAQHAGVIVLSLGSIVDVTTGDGAGWKAQFDSVAWAAEQAGAVMVAAVGNEGLDLSGGRYVELPAQARGVLPVVADTNPACAENLAPNAACAAGPITRAYYSNHGAQGAMAAPGGSLPEGPDTGVSGFVRGACSSGLSNTADGLPSAGGQSLGCFALGHAAYVQAMGTSAAAPLAAGAVAILRAERPTLTPAQIVALLRSTATVSNGLAEPQINLAAALAQ